MLVPMLETNNLENNAHDIHDTTQSSPMTVHLHTLFMLSATSACNLVLDHRQYVLDRPLSRLPT
jgi:hypothetical protein